MTPLAPVRAKSGANEQKTKALFSTSG
jgi:hypothetical protein